MTWLFFIAGFMFLAALLLLAVIYARLYWGMKAALIVLSLLFCGLFYLGLIDSLGYPVQTPPPSLFEFLSAYVREPSRDASGAIYIWLVADKGNPPRAVEIPYSSENRRIVARAKERAQQGQSVYMQLRAGKPQQDGQGGGAATGGGQGRGAQSGDKPYDVHGTPTLEIATPPDTLPRKEGG